MHDDAPGNDTFFASALDMLTCGLGATALLFILFSVVHVEPEKTAGVEQFLNVRFEVSGLNKSALLVPVVRPPGQPEIQVPPVLFDVFSGQLSPPPAEATTYRMELDVLEAGAPSAPGGGYTLVGFSLSDDQAGTLQSGRVFRLHIRRPVAGLWKVSARFFNGARSGLGIRRGDRVHVRTIVTTRDVQKIEEKDVPYPETSSEIEVPIKF